MIDAPEKLRVKGLSKTFQTNRKAHTVLRGLSFGVAEGEFVSLIGESGCGKTTVLRIVQGLLGADAGQVVVDGNVVSGPGRDRGLVFQQANLLPWRTARRNVEFGLELQGLSRSQRSARASELLDLVGLGGFADHYPHQMSGGMQQRIGLARALAIDPAVLLMDEPFSALDAQTREVLQRELLRIHAETRKTVLFVTHDLDEALFLSDRVVILAANPGRVKQVIDIPFERPRAELTDLRGLPEFQQLRSQVWQLIRSTDAGSDRVQD
ncbi:ABC transporter ATP-binding protein [Kribbella sp. NPDC050281]|uniref:ABC transporter ATP-binding protein n=1 Tax=Kribbella sp. NPDC050281 TaxID=3155515 RepID=UPI0033CA40D4